MKGLHAQGSHATGNTSGIGSSEMDDDISSQVDLSLGLFRNLHDLNREYLAHLITVVRFDSVCRDSYLPETIALALGKLSKPQCSSIAQCPYALFDFAFDDAHRWRSVFSFGEPTNDCADNRVYDVKQELGRAILYFVWHAIHVNPLFARFAFGTNAETSGYLGRMSVTQLSAVASVAVLWLKPRWPNNPCFWPDLIRFASGDSAEPLQAAKFLGCQLSAASQFGALSTTFAAPRCGEDPALSGGSHLLYLPAGLR